jgi:hypothetical protein
VKASYGDLVALALVTKTNGEPLKSINKKFLWKPDPGSF